MYYLIGSIIVFMIILMIFICRNIENTFLKGFWRADAEFCNNAELEMFMLYLGDNNSYLSHCRNGYILAANQQGIILNNPIQLDLSLNINLTPSIVKCKKYNATINWQENTPDDSNAFPNKFQVAYYPLHGKLILYKGDEILASLWKDGQMSSLAADIDLLPQECILKNNSL